SLIGALRAAVPGQKILVNDVDWQRGLKADVPWPKRDVVSTYSFYDELVRQPDKPDVLGLEWYPGARIEQPKFKFDASEPCLDLFATSRAWDRLIALGVPLYISEFNVPGAMKPD